MQLTKVEIYGFKSFAKRTEFLFGPGVTGIVGPNGCGKSNLVDAIRWGLGEQRPSLLRSSAMSALVYNGGGPRVDHAEVSLFFDNSDGVIRMDAPEVQITRRLFHSGEGEYLINGQGARLRDVKELFLDTGLGVGGYSFMGQGRIDHILSASALERRMLVEEAAGTSRYRERRKEALRKLQRTEQDLARSNDMLQELERQVRSLKVQAGRARNYVEKSTRLKRMMGVVYARRQRELQASLAELLDQKQAAQAHERELRSQVVEDERLLGEREGQETVLAGDMADRRTEIVEKRARRVHLGTRREELEARAEQCAREREEGRERAEQLQEQLTTLGREREEAERRSQELATEESSRRAEREAAHERGGALQRDTQAAEDRLQSLQGDLLNVVEEQQRLRNEQTDIDSEVRALSGSRRKLAERTTELSRSIAAVAAERHDRHAAARELTARRHDLEAELSADDEQLSEFYRQRQGQRERLEKEAAEAAADQSRLEVLEESIARHEGVNEQVRELLDRAQQGEAALRPIEGIVADLVTPPVETARAVEAALGAWAEALVVPDREAAIQVLRVIRQEGLERVRILSRAELLRNNAHNGNGHRRPGDLLAGAVVEADKAPLLKALLGHFDLLPSDVPMELCSPRAGRALVARNGEIMLTRYETVTPAQRERVGLITRRTECQRLQSSVRSAGAALDVLRAAAVQLDGQIAAREQDRKQRAAQRDEIAAAENEALQELRSCVDRLGLLREELVVGLRESLDIDRRRTVLLRKRVELEGGWQVQEQRRQGLHEERTALHADVQRLVKEHSEAEKQVAGLDLEVARLVERVEGAKDALLALQKRFTERDEHLRHVTGQNQELERQEQAARAGGEKAAADLGLLSTELEGLEEALRKRAEDFEAFRRATSQAREALSSHRRQVEEANQAVQQCVLQEQERRMHLQRLAERVREDLEQEPDTLAQLLADCEAELQRLSGPLAATDAAVNGGTASEGAAGSDQDPATPTSAGSIAGDEADADAATDDTDLSTADAAREARAARRERAKAVAELRELFEQDLEPLEHEVGELKKSLQRLGPVNVEAIDELDEVENRAVFLAHQREDLVQSRRKLRVMIDEIDQECDRRFESTFDQVRDTFRVLFRRLFQGGRADLILQDTEDPSEAGIEVVAAPPGKEQRPLQMLSGGERTMTATAILFSLFSTRPSPFAVLDEVDAALDEANIERFTSMVKDFMNHSQFLIVTHSKRTMAEADTLYGVTMEGNGISRPIAMRFEDHEKARGAVA